MSFTPPCVQVINDANIPAADLNLVRRHMNLLLNTQGGIPSQAARRAVADYQRLGSDRFRHMSYGLESSALRRCGCETCKADLKKR